MLRWLLDLNPPASSDCVVKLLKEKDLEPSGRCEGDEKHDVYLHPEIVDFLLEELRARADEKTWMEHAKTAYAATLRRALMPLARWTANPDMFDPDRKAIYDAIVYNGTPKLWNDGHEFVSQLLYAFVDRLAAVPLSLPEKTELWKAVCGSRRLGCMQLFVDRFSVTREDVMRDRGCAFAKICRAADMEAIDWMIKKFQLTDDDVMTALRTLTHQFGVAPARWDALQKKFGFNRWAILNE